MRNFGWVIRTEDKAIRDKILSEIPAKVCSIMCLCSAVGCDCKENKLCSQVNAGTKYRTVCLDGPDWSIRLMEGDSTVRVDVSIDRAPVGREISDTYGELGKN